MIRRIARLARPFIGMLMLVTMFATTVGCEQHKDRSALIRSVPSTEIRLHTEHTNAPDLTMRVPTAFSDIDWTRNARYDNFMISNPDDTAEIQHGLLVVNVTPSPVHHIPDSVDVDNVIGRLAGKDVEWHEFTVIKPDGSKLYQREAFVRSLLSGYTANGTGPDLVLHVFVVGTSYELVETLTSAAETLDIVHEADV